MSHRSFLGLVAVGAVDPEIVRRLRTAVAKTFSLPVRVLRPLALPESTFHIVRKQYHSTQLLEYLLAEQTPGALRILGITSVDLYIPILTFVFGEAQLNGKAAVISLFRPWGRRQLSLLAGTYPQPAHQVKHSRTRPYFWTGALSGGRLLDGVCRQPGKA